MKMFLNGFILFYFILRYKQEELLRKKLELLENCADCDDETVVRFLKQDSEYLSSLRTLIGFHVF